MHFQLFGCVLVAVLLQAVYVSAAEDACNEYVDAVIGALKEDDEHFRDPYPMPDMSIEIWRKMLFVNHSGIIGITDGKIYGLKTLHRSGDVMANRKGHFRLRIPLGAGEVKMNTSAKIQILGLGPVVKITAKHTFVAMTLDMVQTDPTNNPSVENFRIDRTEGSKVDVKGMGPLSFLLAQVTKIILALFGKQIRQGIEGRMGEFLAEKLQQFVIPEECVNGLF
ncbi:uncharacterized protein LOC129218647 [Uloborus diversus]|uniref:uncharacterized protein LOC129218647 n=1 Tax=Uloborus diversus TaxID=327109 RepID=UPI0024094CCA|nr:uncharacterized protein LOC129218647 [Uloborus diversus]